MMPEPDPLEARLRALHPAALPSTLHDRLLANEPPPVKHRDLARSVPWAGALTGTVALCLLLAVIVTRRPPLHPPARPTVAATTDRVFLPARERSTLLGVSEGDVIDADAEHPVRLVRALWLDDTTYVGEDHSIMHRRTTRTEVVPVALESF